MEPFLTFFMAKRLRTQDEHDIVVAESAKTYWESVQAGNKVDINPDGEHHRSVGKENYPDVIVWKPNQPDSDFGMVIVIEEIETSESVNEVESDQWATYADIGVKFILIVPKESVPLANGIIRRKKIRISELWHYSYDINGNIQFIKSW